MRDTSKEAYKDILPHIGPLQGKVLAALAEHGPMTDKEMQRLLSLSPQTQCPRRLELEAKGFIRDSGERKRLKSGRNAIVWEVTPKKDRR